MAIEQTFEGMESYGTQLTDGAILDGSLAETGFIHGVLSGEIFDDFTIVFHASRVLDYPPREISILEVEEVFDLPTKPTVLHYSPDELINRIGKASFLLSRS